MARDITAFEIVWRNPWVRAITYAVAAAVVFWLLFWEILPGAATAFQVAVIGFVIAYILNPLVMGLKRLRIPRTIAVILVYLALLAVLVLGSVLITQVVTDISRFARFIPDALENITMLLGQAAAWFSGLSENVPDFIANRFSDGVETGGVETGDATLGEGTGQDAATDAQTGDIAERVEEAVQNLLTQAATSLEAGLQEFISNSGNILLSGGGTFISGVTTVFSTTFQIFLILLAGAYFLYDFPKITSNFRRYVPLRYRPFYSGVAQKVDRTVGGYLRGQLIVMLAIGILLWIGLELVGVPSAPSISFLAAIFNIIPYLGPIIGVVPAVLLSFTTGAPLTTAILAVVVFVVANQIEGNFLSPLILSKSTNLHPVTVFIAIIAGFGLFGLVGGLLAVPSVALAKVLVESYLLTRPAYTGEDKRAEEVAGGAEDAALTEREQRIQVAYEADEARQENEAERDAKANQERPSPRDRTRPGTETGD